MHISDGITQQHYLLSPHSAPKWIHNVREKRQVHLRKLWIHSHFIIERKGKTAILLILYLSKWITIHHHQPHKLYHIYKLPNLHDCLYVLPKHLQHLWCITLNLVIWKLIVKVCFTFVQINRQLTRSSSPNASFDSYLKLTWGYYGQGQLMPGQFGHFVPLYLPKEMLLPLFIFLFAFPRIELCLIV